MKNKKPGYRRFLCGTPGSGFKTSGRLIRFNNAIDVGYILILTLPLVANGTTTWRLQRRHLSSTPSATTRASKLPQLQRSELSGFVAAAISRFFCCGRESIYVAFLR